MGNNFTAKEQQRRGSCHFLYMGGHRESGEKLGVNVLSTESQGERSPQSSSFSLNKVLAEALKRDLHPGPQIKRPLDREICALNINVQYRHSEVSESLTACSTRSVHSLVWGGHYC